MLQLKIINKQHYLTSSVKKNNVKACIGASEQTFEIKLNERINPIATPITILYSNNIPVKRFIPFGEEDIMRYCIIKTLIEKLGVKKYFPVVETGSLCLKQGVCNGVFEDLVVFNSTSQFHYLKSLAEQFSNCVPLNVISQFNLENTVLNNVSTFDWQMFLLLVPLMGMWDIALHNILIQVNGSGLYLVHIDFGDVPKPWTGKKHKLIIDSKLLDYFFRKGVGIHPDIIKFINNLDAENICVFENEKVWKKLWASEHNIKNVICKMKELVLSPNKSFKSFFEELSN
jgi:hypothetical protein